MMSLYDLDSAPDFADLQTHDINHYMLVLLLLSFHFNGHFPGEPGLAGVYWSTGWWRWWWQLEL